MSDQSHDAAESYPRQSARTQRFTLGDPRDVTVSADGRRIVFLRSRGGTDPVNCLWVVDATTGEERIVADPELLLMRRDEFLPLEERARRERTRESAGGITAYATDRAGTVAAFTIAGRLFVAGLVSAAGRELPVAGPVFDPRPDPLATRVAYVSGRLLCVGELDGRWRVLAGDDPDEPDTVSWGSADFIAAEEMNRFRGFWWSPDGTVLAATRVDTAPVTRWFVGDPAVPSTAPTEMPYPAAGTPNAEVSLHLLGLDGSVVDLEWDRQALPYLVDVNWSEQGLVLTVQSRDQRRVEHLGVDPATGATTLLLGDDDEHWVELVDGVPRLLPDGTLVTCADRDGARRLMVAGTPVTPADLQVRSVASVSADGIVFLANPLADSTVLHVWRRAPDGTLAA
ncbi:MAG: DPP IV N-terminal domain-containing protein, partial [Acidimicrobiia bacterium]|nr:DPP IV N-terminal domain-containing protein [Acidimicrobiia bacterium]